MKKAASAEAARCRIVNSKGAAIMEILDSTQEPFQPQEANTGILAQIPRG